jgi:hypothetical protein
VDPGRSGGHEGTSCSPQVHVAEVRSLWPHFCTFASVYLIDTNVDYECQPESWCGDEHCRPFSDVINWHNPLHLNKKQVYTFLSLLHVAWESNDPFQPISKWSTHFALGLSNSMPILKFKECNILDEDDTCSSSILFWAYPFQSLMIGFVDVLGIAVQPRCQETEEAAS